MSRSMLCARPHRPSRPGCAVGCISVAHRCRALRVALAGDDMPIHPPRDPIVDPAVPRAGRFGVLLLVAAMAGAAVIIAYVGYKALVP